MTKRNTKPTPAIAEKKPVVFRSEQLLAFCSRAPGRTALQAPFSVGNFTFASDGAVCVRVGKLAEVGSVEGAPLNPNCLFEEAFARKKKLKFRAMAELPMVVESDEIQRVEIGAAHYQARYLRMFAGFEGAEVAPGGGMIVVRCGFGLTADWV